MPYPHDFSWNVPDSWTNRHSRTIRAPGNVPGIFNNPSDFVLDSINPLLLDQAATLSPELLNPGYPGAAADPESYLGSLNWLSDETPFGQTSNEGDGVTSHRHNNVNYHHSFDVSQSDPNTFSSAQIPDIPTAGPSGSSRGRTARSEERRSETATNTGPVKCQWKGCTYPCAFSRRIGLKRHVDTKHISPRSYECPEPGCQKLFNRGDNLRQHLHRMH